MSHSSERPLIDNQKLLILTVIGPTLLDFFFYQTIAARSLRIIIFSATLVLLFQHVLQKQKLNSLNERVSFNPILILYTSLFAIGWIRDIQGDAKLTPEFLIIFCFVVILNVSNIGIEEMMDLIFRAGLILLGASFFCILFSINLRNEYLSADGYFIPFNGIIGIPGRQFGVFAAPNELAQIASLVLAWSMLKSKSHVWKILSTFCLIESGSRAAMAIGFGGILVLIYAKKVIENRSEKTTSNIYIRILQSNALIFVLFTSLLFVASFLENTQSLYLNKRSLIWTIAFAELRENAFFGMGWRWYSVFIESKQLPNWGLNAHNIVLEILFATGILGTFFFIFLLLLSFFRLHFLTVRLIYVLFLAMGVTESTIQFLYPGFTTYFFLSLLFSKVKVSA
jgi:O-antigen ligase